MAQTKSGFITLTDISDGEQGLDGAPGQSEITVYQNGADQPDFPVGGDENTAPTGWTFDPEESETQRFKSVARFPDGNTVFTPEVSEITFSGTTGEAVVVLEETEVTELGITGSTSGGAPDAATAEVTEITFSGTSANTDGGAPSFALEGGTSGVFFDSVNFGSGGSFPAWVAVGASGAIYTTPDLDLNGTSTWTAATVPNTRRVHDVAYDGVGRWLAVCAATGGVTQIWTATNPAGTWVQAGLTGLDSTDEGDEQMNGVTYGEDRWIVVGRDATILTAVDPTLDTDPMVADSWRIVTRAIQGDPHEGFSSQGREFRKVAWNGKTGTDALYTVVGQNDTGGSAPTNVGLLVTANDPTSVGGSGWVMNTGHAFAGHFNDVAFATNSAGDEHWVISTGTSGVFSSVFVVEDPSVTTTSVWDDRLYGSNVGSDMRDITFHNNQWYVGSGSNTQSFMIGTYDTPSDPNGLSWSTGNTIGTTGQLRGVHSNGTDLVFGTANGVYLGSFPSSVGSMLTLIGDISNFPNDNTVMVELGNELSGAALRNDTVTRINDIVADTMDNRIAGLTASAGGADQEMNLTATVGIKTNMLTEIDTGATSSVTSTTEGTDTGGATNQQSNITITGVSGGPFTGITDRAPTLLDKTIMKVGFGDNTWVAVGEPAGASSDGAGTLLTATDPDGTWTPNTSSPVDAATLNDVAYDGTEFWLAVGSNISGDATIITASNPIGTWSDTMQTTVTGDANSITYIDDLSLWILTASSGIWTSTDRVAWTQQVSGNEFFTLEYDADNGLLIAAGEMGLMRSSTTGTSWSTVSSGFNNTTTIRAVGYHIGTWVAVGDSDTISRSTNGTSWNLGTATGTGNNLTGVAFTIDRWLLCTGSGNLRESSDDGVNWTLNLSTGLSTPLRLVSYEGDRLIIVGGTNNSDGLIFTPTDQPTVFTIDGDDSHFSDPIEITFTVGLDGEEMAQQVFNSLDGNANLTNVSVIQLNNTLQIDLTTSGARDPLSLPQLTGGTASIAIVRQEGADSTTIFSTYTITADSAHHSPSTFTGPFDGGTTAAQALVIIRNLFTGVTPEIGGYTAATISGTTFTVTSTTPGAEDDLVFTITDGTKDGVVEGNLVESRDVTNDGVDPSTTGGPDDWTTVINRTTYTGVFPTALGGSGQALEQATQLNALVVADPVFTAARVGITNVLRITARDNGNQYDTTTSITRGEGSTSNATPPVVITDGIVNPDWSQPVQDGFRGGLGLRGAGRHDRNFTVTTAVAPDVVSTVFNEAARCAVAGGYPFNTTLNVVDCRPVDDVNSTIAVPLAEPVEGDVVVLTVTESDGGTATRGAIHDGTGIANDDWVPFAVQIDGNLLVDGTIVTDKLAAGAVDATKIAAGAITIGAVTTSGVPNLSPEDVGAGSGGTSGERMVITGSRIQIFDDSGVLRVVLGDLDP